MTQGSPFRRAMKLIEKQVDEEIQDYINTITKNGGTAIDVAMADKVFRQFLTLIEVHKFMETDPEQVYDALITTITVMTTELVLNTHSKLSQQPQIYARANDVMNKYARAVEKVLQDSLPAVEPMKPH